MFELDKITLEEFEEKIVEAVRAVGMPALNAIVDDVTSARHPLALSDDDRYSIVTFRLVFYKRAKE